MTDEYNSKKITTVDGNFIKDMVLRFKLITRLMGDRRVSGLTKLLPWGSLAYLLLPFDFIPGGLMTGIGAADDVAIMWFGFTLFLELCPTDVVDEHIIALTGQSVSSTDGDIVDAEIVDLDD